MSKYINMDRVKEVFDYAENEFCECDYAVKNIREAVENLPAADVRPVVHGHWEESPMNGIVCSECGRERPLEPFGETEWNSDFCPWCGADMREGRVKDE